MLGDGHCDSTCNNSDCGWDSLDCGCAADCSFTDLGTCKATCLVPDCNYDAYPGYPACGNKIATTAAQYYQMLTHAFNSTFSYAMCAYYTPTCTLTKFTAALTSCQNECNSVYCLYGFGSCQPSEKDCQVPLMDRSRECFKCKDEYNFFTDCVENCPGGYAPHPLVTHLCYPQQDLSTEDHPTVYYVDNAAGQNKGQGTLEDPFHSLATAFATVTSKYTAIHLLPGTHVLNLTEASSFMFDIAITTSSTEPNTNGQDEQGSAQLNAQYVSVSKLTLCAADPNHRPTLQYVNTSPVSISLLGHTEIVNIDFNAHTPLSNCTSPRCFYCSYVVLDTRDGILKTDRGTSIGDEEYLPSAYCERFASSSFITANGHMLTLVNVTFTDFRQGFTSLINLSYSNSTFFNVNFSNIITTTAVILHSNTINVPVCYSTFFIYISGTVQMLNNGFELLEDTQKSVFLRADCAGLINFEEVTFQYNFVPDSSDNKESKYGSLIVLDLCLKLTVKRCLFDHNYGVHGTALKLFSTTLQWSTVIADPRYLQVMSEQHLVVQDCEFRNNTGSSILAFLFEKDLQTVVVTRCQFTHELSLDHGVVTVENDGKMDENEKNGQEKVIIDGSGNRIKKYFPPCSVEVSVCVFQSCSTDGDGMIEIEKMPNLQLSDLLFAQGAESETAYTTTLLAFTEHPDIYMRNEVEKAPSECDAVIAVGDSYKLQINGVRFTGVRCTKGAVVDVKGMEGTLSLNSIIIEQGYSSTSGGGMISIAECKSVSLASVAVSDCHVEGTSVQSVVQIGGSTSLALHSCSFSRNSAGYYGALAVKNVPTVVIESTVFDSNIAEGDSGGGVSLLLPSTARVTFAHCSFTSNQAYQGGAISAEVSGTVATMALFVQQSLFRGNSANTGGAIAIAKEISFVNSSAIVDCEFVENEASRGVLSLEFSGGLFSISDSVFNRNNGTMTSVLVASFAYDFETSLHLTANNFTENTGPFLISLAGQGGLQSVRMEKVRFESNLGCLLQVQSTLLEVLNAVCYNNTASTHPVFVLEDISLARFSLARFEKNKASTGSAGVGLVGGQSTFICSKCTFTGNKAARKAAALYLEQNSIVNITSSAFTGNTAGESGSALYFLGCEVASELRDCTFSDNFSGGDGVISLISSSLLMTSGRIHDNRSSKSTAGVVLNLSNLTATDYTFSSQSGVSGTFMYITTESMAKIVDCHFQGGVATSSGAAITVIGSSLSVAGSTFEQLESPLGSALFVYSHSVLSVTTSSFISLNVTNQHGGCVYVYQSDFTISDSIFSSNTDSAISSENSKIVIERTVIEGNFHTDSAGAEGIGLYCNSCPYAVVTDSEFRRLTGSQSGAIDFGTGLDVKASLTVLKSRFYNNTGQHNAGISAQNAECVVDGCEFVRNTANSLESGIGGAISLSCPLLAATCRFSITDSDFSTNTAKVKGGAIAWDDVMPVTAGSSFYNNSAAYGSDISSYAVRLVTANSSVLEDVASGQVFAGVLRFTLVDHYGNPVAIDSESTAEMTSTKAAVTGLNKVTASNGIFTFKDFAITATPGSTISVSVSTNAVDVSKKVYSGDTEEYSSEVTFEVRMRNCTKGESEVNGQCIICGQGQYSLDPKLSCQDCPSAAICYGNYTMVPRSGYWRSSMDTSTFFACPFKPACIGSPESPQELSYTGLCAEGYEGNLCHSCGPNYSRKSKAECSKCPASYVNVIRLAGIAAATILAVVILVKSSIASAKQPKALHSVYLKIFMNYLQLVMLTATFNLSWPSFVLELFSAQESAGDVTEQVFSIDCFINQDSSDDVFFDKLLLMSFVPLILLLAAVIVWLVVACRRRSLQCLRNELLGTCIILFFLAHPSIVKSMFSIFSCRQINPGEYWVTAQLNIRCWQGEHLEYALCVALPSIILWGIGIPTACLFAIMIERKHFHLEDMKIRFGFLVNGYRQAAYYWEFVILYRKLTIISISVFLSQISVPVQALAVMGVLVIVVVLQKKHRPFLKKSLNETEMRSILVAAITIYCGLYYLTEDLGEFSKILLFMIIVVANGYFMLSWLRHMMGVTLIYLMKKVPILNRCFHAKSEEALGLAREQDFFAMELAYNWQREEIPPPTMKDLYMAYLQDRVPVTPASESEPMNS